MSHPTIPLQHTRLDPAEMRARANAFYECMQARRTVRDFSAEHVPRELIEIAIRTAGTSPSGANQQAWQFVAIREPGLKKQIREAAEAEEREFYQHRANEQWLSALAPLGTDENKPFLDTAPWLIAIFYEAVGVAADGGREKRYYPVDSVGIATGLLIAALHQAGLATLTHTPSPMAFLNQLLDRPDNERPFLLLVVGFPAEGARVPDISRKSLAEIAQFR